MGLSFNCYITLHLLTTQVSPPGQLTSTSLGLDGEKETKTTLGLWPYPPLLLANNSHGHTWRHHLSD